MIEEAVMDVLRAMHRRKGSAPGPDALTHELLAHLGERTAEVMANSLQQCYRPM